MNFFAMFSQVTYQEQQAILKKQQQAAAAEQQRLQELEQARADTWLVFVLVELLGSFLITPTWEHAAPASAGVTGITRATSATSVTRDAGDILGSSGASKQLKGLQLLSGEVGSTSIDLMDRTITYPQFVEVLLVMMGLRYTAVLAPGQKQLPSLALDVEMQVGHKVVDIELVVTEQCFQSEAKATAFVN